jgi:histidine ammonia-lyase
MTVGIGERLAFEDVIAVAARGERVHLASGVAERVAASRRIVEETAAESRAVYGVNTGVGHLANVRIDPADATALQHSLVRAHATAVGSRLPSGIVRAMLLLKARTFAFGNSGVRLEILRRIADLLNHDIHPIVPAQGSLGASGDLAPLAHMALAIVGEGDVEHEGSIVSAKSALAKAGLDPLPLTHKEGLSLINGTEGMLACGIFASEGAKKIAETADITGAMSVEACLGTDASFREDVVSLRKHPGAQTVAANVRRFLAGSEIVASHKESEHLVQDAYSLRCIPQVHGAYRDALDYVRSTLEAELESAIDNPSVLPATREIATSGNFHGEALGLAMDHLSLCLTGFATIAERRIARLIDPALSNGLPAFLTTDPGRRSGFMIAHYAAASITSENKSLCTPASADSIPTSAGQEDHVSMGLTSARKALAVLANTQKVIAVEALAAAQGIDLRGQTPGRGTKVARDVVRSVSPYLEADRSLSAEIEAVAALVADGSLSATVIEQTAG